VHDGRTFTTVDDVAGNDRVAEIARMLAGSETTAAIEHAKDLLG
jgi:DNA repair protein RecN (Recombination protein N)